MIKKYGKGLNWAFWIGDYKWNSFRYGLITSELITQLEQKQNYHNKIL